MKRPVVILQSMDWYEPDVQALEAEHNRRSPVVHPTVFYGSSTIRLWTDLARDLDAPEALNLGFGGSTLEACVYFFDRLVVPEHPSSLVVYAGDNDIGDGRSAQQVFAYFKAFASKVRIELGDIPFGFISIKPSPARFPLVKEIREANRLIKQQISQVENAYFVNLFDQMLRPDQTPRTELFESDGLHMNRFGYQLWSKLLKPYRNRMFTPQTYEIQSATVSSKE